MQLPMTNTGAHRVLALTSLLWLAACGGGSGDGASEAPPLTQLAVVSSNPAPDARDVPRTAPLAVTFNDTLDPAGMAEAVQLVGPLGQPLPVTVQAEGATLRVRPQAGGLPGEARYTLRLGAGLRGMAGKTLGREVSGTFTTAAPRWTPTQELPYSSSLGVSAQALDGAGVLTQVWSDSAGVYAVRRAGGISSEQVRLSNHHAEEMFAASVGADTTVAWLDPIGSNRPQARATTYRDGAWGPVVELSREHARAFRMASSPHGAAAVWLESTSTTEEVVRLAWLRNGQWSEPLTLGLGNPSGSYDTPMLAIDNQGVATVAWQRRVEPTRMGLEAVRMVDGQVGTPQLVSRPGALEASGQDLVADAQGRIMLMWNERPADAGPIEVVSRRFESGTWQAAQLVAPRQSMLGRPALAVDALGTVTAMWHASREDQDTYALVAARWSNGAWEPLTQVDAVVPVSYPPQLVVDVAGHVTAAWFHARSNSEELRTYWRRWAHGAWTEPAPLDESIGQGDVSGLPLLSIDASGSVTAWWVYLFSYDKAVTRLRRLE
jgi:hypothetical protein